MAERGAIQVNRLKPYRYEASIEIVFPDNLTSVSYDEFWNEVIFQAKQARAIWGRNTANGFIDSTLPNFGIQSKSTP